jgi:hypothetical protein
MAPLALLGQAEKEIPMVGRHRVLVGVVAGALLVGAAGLAAASPGRSSPASLTPAADPEGFVGVSPTRVLDTRAGDGPIGVPTAAPLGANQEIVLPLTTPAPNRASAPVPANAVSVLINITIDKNASADSFITVWPTGQPRPNSSANNATPGQVTPNSIVVPLGAGGSVSIYNFTGNVDLAVDLAGYTVPLAGSTIQGAPGPKGDTGPQGPQGPPGPQGPIGPVIGADWKTATNASEDLSATPVVVAAVGPFPAANFVVTASFRAVTASGTTSIQCDIVDSQTLTGTVLTSMTKPEHAGGIDDAMTLTVVAESNTGDSLVCSTPSGTGLATIEEATIIAVGVGDELT